MLGHISSLFKNQMGGGQAPQTPAPSMNMGGDGFRRSMILDQLNQMNANKPAMNFVTTPTAAPQAPTQGRMNNSFDMNSANQRAYYLSQGNPNISQNDYNNYFGANSTEGGLGYLNWALPKMKSGGANDTQILGTYINYLASQNPRYDSRGGQGSDYIPNILPFLSGS